MAVSSSMRRIWLAISFTVALLSFWPAWTGRTGWLLFGISFTLFAVILVEPWLLTWELRKSGDPLQINDDGVLRRIARGQSEYVRWSDLREVALVVPPGAGEYFYVLAGTGKSGVLISQSLAARHDLLSHLGKLPGFDHRNIPNVLGVTENQRYVLWQARSLEGEATVVPIRRIEPPQRTLH